VIYPNDIVVNFSPDYITSFESKLVSISQNMHLNRHSDESRGNERSFYLRKAIKLCQKFSTKILIFLTEEWDTIWMGVDTSICYKSDDDDGDDVNSGQSTDIDNTDLFSRVILNNLIFQKLQELLSYKDGDLNNLLNVSRRFEMLKNVKYRWKLNKTILQSTTAIIHSSRK
jgi:hypothetical protein